MIAEPTSNAPKTYFFDDDDVSAGFPFQKPNSTHFKELNTPAVIITKLSREVRPGGALEQCYFSLYGKLLCYHTKKDPSSQPEQILNLTNSQLRLVGLHPSTMTHVLSITKNGIKYDFHSEEEQTINIWMTALKQVCVMTNFHEEYKAVKMIGKGSFAKVYLVESKSTGKNFAVKAFTKESLILSNKNNAKPSMVNEIHIMRILDHDNIIKLYEVYETERSIYLVLELITGKSLQDILKKNGFKDNENRIINIISSILDALAYLASKGIMHRDLKPDNILIDKGDKVKIADFGLATFIDVPEYIFKKCGTPGYIAPEVFKYDQKNPATFYDDHCDVFSAGCILFYMLFGFLFFDGPNASEILKTNRKFTLDFQTLATIKEELASSHSKHSKNALDLLVKLLDFDQKKRISAAESLTHAYVSDIIQQKIAGSYDVYQNSGYSPDVYNKRNSVVSEQILQQMKGINSPQPRFAEKDSLYLDVGRPELTGKIDTLTNGSTNNSLLLQRNDSNGPATPNSASTFAKNSSPSRSSKVGNVSANKPSLMKAAIFRNMQKNSEMEESKDDTALSAHHKKMNEIKNERRHSDFITNKINYPIQQQNDKQEANSSSSSGSGSNDDEDEMDEKPQVNKQKEMTASPGKIIQNSVISPVKNPMQGQNVPQKGL